MKSKIPNPLTNKTNPPNTSCSMNMAEISRFLGLNFNAEFRMMKCAKKWLYVHTGATRKDDKLCEKFQPKKLGSIDQPFCAPAYLRAHHGWSQLAEYKIQLRRVLRHGQRRGPVIQPFVESSTLTALPKRLNIEPRVGCAKIGTSGVSFLKGSFILVTRALDRPKALGNSI